MEKQELRKAAIVLASLDRETAAAICKQMSEVEAEMVLNEIALLGTVTREDQEKALSSFHEQLVQATQVGGRGVAEELMSAALGRKKARFGDPEHQSTLEQLRNLNNTDAHTLHRLLAGETTQMAALVLGQLSPEKAAEVLIIWPEEERGDVALRLAKQSVLAPGAVEAIGEVFGQHAHHGDEESAEDVGIGFLVKLLEEMDRRAGKALLDQVRAQDEELATEVEDQLFTFEDVVQLREKDLRLMLRALEGDMLARALKGVHNDILERVFANLSARGREILEQEMEMLGPVLVREVEAAQKEFVKKALELEEAGEIILASDEDEYIK